MARSVARTILSECYQGLRHQLRPLEELHSTPWEEQKKKKLEIQMFLFLFLNCFFFGEICLSLKYSGMTNERLCSSYTKHHSIENIIFLYEYSGLVKFFDNNFFIFSSLAK